MSGFWGMDTAQADGFREQLDRGTTVLADTAENLRTLVGATIGNGWVGPDAEEFQQAFEQRCAASIDSAVDRLRAFFDDLGGHIDAQETASSGESDGGSVVVGGNPGVGNAFFPGAANFFDTFGDWISDTIGDDWSWREWGEKILDNLNPLSGPTGAITIRSFFHSLAELAGAVIPKWFPVIGDIYTAGMAAVERWAQDRDSGEYSAAQMFARAAFDGAMTGGGSILGRLGGEAGGAALGGALGVETGPGVIGTAAIGKIVGGFAGSVVGSALLGGLADSILD